MTSGARRLIPAVIVLASLVCALLLRVFVFPSCGPQISVYHDSPVGIMGTETNLTALVPYSSLDIPRQGVKNAELALRRIEAMMSAHLEFSELSIFNASTPGEPTELSPELMDLLRTARKFTADSDGAFDVTVGPLIKLWKDADGAKEPPSDQQVQPVRAMCGWNHIELRQNAAVRLTDSVTVDLGGIAKGYGIDQAADAMKQAGCSAGVIDVGGDVRFFGQKPDGQQWTFTVDNPFGEGFIGTFKMDEGAVCTSGNYRRNVTIGGKRYSHIIDPRTGWPAETSPSVTVLAPTATIADAWATALSVRGPDGLALLPEGVEAMLVIGTTQKYSFVTTEGFMERHWASDADNQIWPGKE